MPQVTDYFSIDESNPGILKAWLMGKDRAMALTQPSPKGRGQWKLT